MSKAPEDSLTVRLRKELGLRSSRGAVSPTAPTTPIPPVASRVLGSSLWGDVQKSGTPDWYIPTADWKEPTGAPMINALGAFTWSFIDTASFGVADWLLPEVGEMIDYDDPAAKWTGAIGGFAGFVAGAPMKIAGKLVQKGVMLAAKPALKSLGKKSADEVIGAARRIGKKGGLTRKQTKNILEKYRALVTKAQIDPMLKAGQFEKKALDLIDTYVANGILNGTITKAESEVFKNMFKVGGKTLFGKQTSNLLTRPIQDITGIMFARG